MRSRHSVLRSCRSCLARAEVRTQVSFPLPTWSTTSTSTRTVTTFLVPSARVIQSSSSASALRSSSLQPIVRSLHSCSTLRDQNTKVDDRAKPRPARTHSQPIPQHQLIEGATDLSHAHFIASASPKSDFNPSQRPEAGQDLTSDSDPVDPDPALQDPSDSASATVPVPGTDSSSTIGSATDPAKGGGGTSDTPTNEEGQWLGKLSPTSSHLFKLLLPLPSNIKPSVTATTGPVSPSKLNLSASTAETTTPRQTAFLLHPSQPLSHLSRLIIGSLPTTYRDSEITYLSLTGQASDLDSHLRHAEEQDDRDISGRQEGGPFLGERIEEQGRWQEVSWSQSTDLSDFIKQSCLNERFKIVITPTSILQSSQSQLQARSDQNGLEQNDAEAVRELVLEIVIPSFASRTHYIRRRLLSLTQNLSKMTKQKKSIDYKAHKGAQRLAVAALGGGVAYWMVVLRYTFFTDAGWDLMEPVTWATGFAALLGSAAFLIYHNREVSYSSLLDLSITARQRKLYGEAGLDIERWTEMVAEAKTLRREISRIAADYDIEWRGELENLAQSAPATLENRRGGPSSGHGTPTRPRDHSASKSSDGHHDKGEKTTSRDSPESSVEARGGHGKDKVQSGSMHHDEDGNKLDVDATISEAAELAEQSESKRSQERSAQRKGQAVEPSAEGDAGRNGSEGGSGKHGTGGKGTDEIGDADRGTKARLGEESESESEARGRKKARAVIEGE